MSLNWKLELNWILLQLGKSLTIDLTIINNKIWQQATHGLKQCKTAYLWVLFESVIYHRVHSPPSSRVWSFKCFICMEVLRSCSVTTTLHKTYVNLCFPSKMSYFSPALRNKIIPPHDAVKFSEFLSKCWTSTISLMSTNTGSNITWTITKQSLWGTGPSREPFSWFTQHWDTFRALFSELLSVCYDNTKWKKKNPLTHTHAKYDASPQICIQKAQTPASFKSPVKC